MIMVKDVSIRCSVNSLALNTFLGQTEFSKEKPLEIETSAPKRVIVKEEDKLIAKLDISRKDIEEGRTTPADEVYSRLETKYAL